MSPHLFRVIRMRIVIATLLLLSACTPESQNQISRSFQNWTGTNGVLEIYSGNQTMRRFIHIDKLSAPQGNDAGGPRAYRFGYGVLDENLNMQQDAGEKKVYFEVSDYATSYLFFESPR